MKFKTVLFSYRNQKLINLGFIAYQPLQIPIKESFRPVIANIGILIFHIIIGLKEAASF